MTMTLKGDKELIAQLNSIANADYVLALEKGVKQEVLPEMQRLTPVDRGWLKASERVDIEDGVVLLIAGDGKNVDYPVYVELGTSKMSPQPFMRPAVDNKSDAALRVAAEEVNHIMEKAV